MSRSMTKPAAWISLIATTVGTALFLGVGQSPWRPSGLALLGLAFAGYAVLIAGGARALPTAAIVVAIGVLFVQAVVMRPVASRDYWAYAMYGRMVAEHGANPYTTEPAAFPDDPAYARINPVWQHTRSAYGPLFTGVSAVGMRAVSSPLAIRLYFQLLAAFAMAVVLWIVWRRTRDPVAIAFIGLHPVVPASVVNGAHNDALVGLAIVGAVIVLGRRAHVASGLAFAAGALVKIVGAFPLVAATWWTYRRRGAREAVLLGGAGAFVTALGYVFVGASASAAALRDSARYLTAHSIARVFWPGASQASDDAAAIVTAMGVVALVAGMLVAIVVARRSTAAITSAMPLLFYVLLAAYVLPWYIAWILPVLALDHRSVAARASATMGAMLMVAYWPVRVLGEGGAEDLVRPMVRWVIPAITAGLIVLVVWSALRTGKQKAPAANREPSVPA